MQNTDHAFVFRQGAASERFGHHLDHLPGCGGVLEVNRRHGRIDSVGYEVVP